MNSTFWPSALYLDLQHIRFGERLVVEKKIPPDLLEAAVPSLLVQPLVENAVKHGLEKRDRPLHLSLTVRREDEQIFIQILDDGPGLSSDGSPIREGVGLGNARARLALLYGAAQSLELRNRPAGGAALVCRLPFHLASTNSSSTHFPWPYEP